MRVEDGGGGGGGDEGVLSQLLSTRPVRSLTIREVRRKQLDFALVGVEKIGSRCWLLHWGGSGPQHFAGLGISSRDFFTTEPAIHFTPIPTAFLHAIDVHLQGASSAQDDRSTYIFSTGRHCALDGRNGDTLKEGGLIFDYDIASL